MARSEISDDKVKLDPGPRARALVRGQDRAGMATIMPDTGAPYASLVIYACDFAGLPVFLLSDLAQHSINIAENAATSLLIDGVAGLEDPLTGMRVTLMGRLEEFEPGPQRDRFLIRHPSSELYAGFEDFRWYRFLLERCHLVAGFGAIDWIDPVDFLFEDSAASALAAAEREIIDHMNDDHADAIQLFAANILGLRGSGWRMTGLDPEGFDLRRGGELARLRFDTPVVDAEAARRALVALVAKARGLEG